MHTPTPVGGAATATTAAAGGPSLDQRTHLDRQGYWLATAYPEAGEATITWVGPRTACVDEGEPPPKPPASDAEREEANWQRANRRAKSESRRFMVANRLHLMWVLTFQDALQGPEGRVGCMKAVAAFSRRLRSRFGVMPYWYSPELHPGGHGWHVNFFVGKRLPHAEMRRLWGHGHVWVKDWCRDSRVRSEGLTVLDAVRLGAKYGCKYASKDWGRDSLVKGARRFNTAEGYTPRTREAKCEHFGTAYRAMVRVFGGDPDSHWRSEQAQDWDGPPVWVLQWKHTVGVPIDLDALGIVVEEVVWWDD